MLYLGLVHSSVLIQNIFSSVFYLEVAEISPVRSFCFVFLSALAISCGNISLIECIARKVRRIILSTMLFLKFANSNTQSFLSLSFVRNWGEMTFRAGYCNAAVLQETRLFKLSVLVRLQLKLRSFFCSLV